MTAVELIRILFRCCLTFQTFTNHSQQRKVLCTVHRWLTLTEICSLLSQARLVEPNVFPHSNFFQQNRCRSFSSISSSCVKSKFIHMRILWNKFIGFLSHWSSSVRKTGMGIRWDPSHYQFYGLQTSRRKTRGWACPKTGKCLRCESD